MTLIELQADIRRWHDLKYGRDPLYALGNKLAEECGELCRAIDRLGHAKTDTASREALLNLPEELGDVAIVLIAIASRGGLDFETVLRNRAAAVLTR